MNWMVSKHCVTSSFYKENRERNEVINDAEHTFSHEHRELKTIVISIYKKNISEFSILRGLDTPTVVI